jgi:RecA/RadA recombinase
MINDGDDTLESVFEEILEEFQSGKRDKAAELQARAIAESNHPDDLFRAYLLIRAKKITLERALDKELAEKERDRLQEKIVARGKREREIKQTKLRLMSIAILVIAFLSALSLAEVNGVIGEFLIGSLIFLFILPIILKWIF